MGENVGRVAELWRYPVKSMQGERVERAELTRSGLVDDRVWAVRDEDAGELTGAKHVPALLGFAARFVEGRNDDGVRHVSIAAPDGREAATTDLRSVNALLCDALGRRVTLSSLRPASDRAHYRKARSMRGTDSRALLGLEPDEPFPDVSSLPLSVLADLAFYVTPPGTYVDACPLHILTTASLDAMRAHAPDATFDVRRFRPSFLVETCVGVEGLVEEGWCDGRLRIGDTVIRVETRTVRCSMPARAQPGLDADPAVARTVSRQNGRHLGVYASVERGGTLEAGAPVVLEAIGRGALGTAAHTAAQASKRAALRVARRVLLERD